MEASGEVGLSDSPVSENELISQEETYTLVCSLWTNLVFQNPRERALEMALCS